MLNAYCHITTKFHALKGDKKGVTAMEYALLGALVAVVIAGTVTTLGTNIRNTLSSIARSV